MWSRGWEPLVWGFHFKPAAKTRNHWLYIVGILPQDLQWKVRVSKVISLKRKTFFHLVVLEELLGKRDSSEQRYWGKVSCFQNSKFGCYSRLLISSSWLETADVSSRIITIGGVINLILHTQEWPGWWLWLNYFQTVIYAGNRWPTQFKIIWRLFIKGSTYKAEGKWGNHRR